MASPNNTVISIPGQSIIDTNGNTWTIVGGRVAINGVVDQTTANVIQMAYESGTVWQKNTANLWWGKSSATASWQPPLGTSTDPVPNQIASTNDTIVTVIPNVPTASITDAAGNIWSINKGQVTLNGMTDPTTANIVELAYVSGKIWQENSAGLWWSKSKPADQWGPNAGTSISPVSHMARTWIGGIAEFTTPGGWTPNGIPQAGDTAIVKIGTVSMTPGFGTKVNFALQGGGMAFTSSGTFNTGTWTGPGSVMIGYPGQTVLLTTTGIKLTGGALDIHPFASAQVGFAIHGNSSLSGGAVLNAQLIGTGSLPRAPIENDGTMTVNGSTLEAGQLTGQGVVQATNNSTISLISASASETVQLAAAHLYVGGGPNQSSTAMQFLAPITKFGATSEITLNNTQATRAVFANSGATAGQLFLYNGATMVADLHISGQAQFYASNVLPDAVPGSVLVTAYNPGHSL